MSTQPSKTILITGAAGFIGFHLSKRLLESGICIIGFDNINSYYDPSQGNNKEKNAKNSI